MLVLANVTHARVFNAAPTRGRFVECGLHFPSTVSETKDGAALVEEVMRRSKRKGLREQAATAFALLRYVRAKGNRK